MNILSIGTDRNILNSWSESAKRQAAYGAHVNRLDIIVFSGDTKSQPIVTVSANVQAYPTRSRSRILYGFDALRIARTLPKPDVVTVQDPFETGLIGWIIARMLGAKFHVQVHTDFLNLPYARHSIVNRPRRNIATFVIPRADRIRVVSTRIKEGIEKYYAPKVPISVLPIYTDIARFQGVHAGLLAGRFAKFRTRLLVVARLEKEKNIALAIESFAQSAPRDACLIILGDGRERRVLERRASVLGIANRVFFEGATDPLPYYAAADLVLVPSHYEGYSLVIIEALAAGKPVLATDVGVAREAGAIIADTAHFADALKEWYAGGSRTGILQGYPYASFEDYVQKYVEDLRATMV